MRKIFNYSNLVLFGGLAFIIFMFAILASESSNNYNLRNKSDALEAQIVKLQAQIEDLNYQVNYYKTDSYRELLAREKLNMAAPGESVVIIKDDKKPQPALNQSQPMASKSDKEELSKKSNLEQWRIFLFGN